MEQTIESSQPEKKSFWKWIYRFRSLLLAIPVVTASVILAIYNMIKLPAVVGINMQSNGEYAMAVAKDAGFDCVTLFQKRQPVEIPIE